MSADLVCRTFELARKYCAVRIGAARRAGTSPFVYGGDLRWAAWPDGRAGAGATWRCVRAVAPVSLLSARLAGDAGPPPGALSTAARRKADADASAPSTGRRWNSSPTLPSSPPPSASLPPPRLSLPRWLLRQDSAACRGARAPSDGGAAATFLAASAELQLLSSALLLRLRGAIASRLHSHQLEVRPPLELWDRSEVFHQTAAGRTPSQPALLAATALAAAVHNVS